MPARSVVIQLQAGVGQAILPDHRKMVPGVQYVIDWDTFQKISNSARQNVIQVVTVNNDSTQAGSFVAAQTASVNGPLALSTILTTTTTSAVNYNLAGFAGQGYDGVSSVGVGPLVSGSATNNVLIGPANERYMYVYNNNVTATSGQVFTWADENNRFVTVTRPTFTVLQDGQGTSYQATVTNTGTSPVTIGTKQGRFAGVALSTFSGSAYGWIQIEGICPAVAVSGTITAGQTLAVGVSGIAKTQAASTASVSGNVVTGTALANNVFGTALSANASGAGFVTVDIRGVKAKKPYVRVLNKN